MDFSLRDRDDKGRRNTTIYGSRFVGKDGKVNEMKVSMSNHEIEIIKKYLNKDIIMLEWGSGGSTTYFPQFVKKYYSIEHDKVWFDRVKNELPDNCELFWVKQNAPRTRPSKRHEFKDYVEYVNSLGIEHFDAVLIDGRARIHCAVEVLPYIDENTVVFFHDFHRGEYQSTLEHYEQIDRAETLAVLKVKNGKK